MKSKKYEFQSILGLTLFTLLAANSFGAAWQTIPGAGWVSVAAQSDGTALATDVNGNVQRINGSTASLVSAVGRQIGVASLVGATRYRVAGKGASVFVVDQGGSATSGSIYQIDSATGAPAKLPGNAAVTQVGPDGTAYALSNGALYRSCVCARAGEAAGFKWMLLAVSGPNGDPLKSVSAGSAIWASTNSNAVMRWNSTTLTWDAMPALPAGTSILEISAADDGTVAAITANWIYSLDLAARGGPVWRQLSWSYSQTPFSNASASNANVFWAVNAKLQLMVYR
ncbi:MAG: hypothetical protein U0Q16_10135 [Bryobacteraceae bacterium]